MRQLLLLCLNVLLLKLQTTCASNIFGEVTCLDDDSFAFNDNPKLTCEKIQKNETRRQKYCKKDEVHERCPLTCGDCCEDDENFSFNTPQKNNANCKWLARKANRQARFCNKFKQMKKVKLACPFTCDFCFNHDTPTAAPTTKKQPTASPIPTTTPSCVDDPDFFVKNKPKKTCKW